MSLSAIQRCLEDNLNYVRHFHLNPGKVLTVDVHGNVYLHDPETHYPEEIARITCPDDLEENTVSYFKQADKYEMYKHIKPILRYIEINDEVCSTKLEEDAQLLAETSWEDDIKYDITDYATQRDFEQFLDEQHKHCLCEGLGSELGWSWGCYTINEVGSRAIEIIKDMVFQVAKEALR